MMSNSESNQETDSYRRMKCTNLTAKWQKEGREWGVKSWKHRWLLLNEQSLILWLLPFSCFLISSSQSLFMKSSRLWTDIYWLSWGWIKCVECECKCAGRLDLENRPFWFLFLFLFFGKRLACKLRSFPL